MKRSSTNGGTYIERNKVEDSIVATYLVRYHVDDVFKGKQEMALDLRVHVLA